MGNLCPNASWIDVKNWFEPFGRVMDVFVKQSSNSHKGSFIFVRFREKKDMLKAIECGDPSVMNGRFLQVKMANMRKIELTCENPQS